MKSLRRLVLLGLFAPVIACAQDTIPVEIVHRGSDQVGQLVVSELKSALKDHRMGMATDRQKARIVVYLSSADNDTQLRGSSSALAVTIVFDAPRMPAEGAFLTSAAQSCAKDSAAICARTVAARVDEEVARLRKNWPSLWNVL